MVQQKGDNSFFVKCSGISFSLRILFHKTAAGVTQRDYMRIAFPPRTRFKVPTLVPEDLVMEGGERGGRRVGCARRGGWMVGRMTSEGCGCRRGGVTTVNGGPDEDRHGEE